MASSLARGLLRRETADLHEALDAALSRADFDDVAAYADFLRRQAGPLIATEAAIDAGPLPTVLADWSARRRTDSIAHDLAVLGAAGPDPRAPVHLDGHDEALGALYVLEGSRLGAKFLVRRARASRDARVRAATAYLGHGEDQPFWPRYLVHLAAREAGGLDHAALVAGARIVFDRFIAAAQADRVAAAAC